MTMLDSRFQPCAICMYRLHKCSLYPRKHSILTGEGILACGHGYSPRLPTPWNLWAVANCGFPTSKADSVNRFSFEVFFPVFLGVNIQEKDLPLTVAGQQWLFTIFPSVMKRD
jgi:hypothetical protein